MQYTDYEDNALENDGVLGDKTISAWNEFIEDKGVTNYLGSVYNYVNPSTTTTSNLYGALDYSSNYADNLDFNINQNYAGSVSPYLESQGYINPSSVETNANQGSSIASSYPAYAYSSINDITANMQISASGSEILEMASDSLSIVGGLYGNISSNEISDYVYGSSNVGGKAISGVLRYMGVIEGVSYALAGDNKNAVITLGGVAVGAVASIAASALIVGGTASIAIPVIAGVAGGIVGEMLFEKFYEEIYEK
ncbi:MAG: hypothetical protein R3Y32_05485 [Bacillota bacterium]